MNVSAFVLAGGRSSRMGSDKALLRIGDESFLSLALRKTQAVCPTPVIVGDPGLYAAFGPVVEDRFPGCGPLGGIHAALSMTRTELNLILSVDLPLMKAEFLRWLVNEAAQGNELATVPRHNDRNEPLCAVYRRSLLPAVEEALQAGQYKVDRIFSQAATRFISEDEMSRAGFQDEIFRNVNTPAEYEWVKQRLAAVGAW